MFSNNYGAFGQVNINPACITVQTEMEGCSGAFFPDRYDNRLNGIVDPQTYSTIMKGFNEDLEPIKGLVGWFFFRLFGGILLFFGLFFAGMMTMLNTDGDSGPLPFILLMFGGMACMFGCIIYSARRNITAQNEVKRLINERCADLNSQYSTTLNWSFSSIRMGRNYSRSFLSINLLQQQAQMAPQMTPQMMQMMMMQQQMMAQGQMQPGMGQMQPGMMMPNQGNFPQPIPVQAAMQPGGVMPFPQQQPQPVQQEQPAAIPLSKVAPTAPHDGGDKGPVLF